MVDIAKPDPWYDIPVSLIMKNVPWEGGSAVQYLKRPSKTEELFFYVVMGVITIILGTVAAMRFSPSFLAIMQGLLGI